MEEPAQMYVALAVPWARQWDVHLLDPDRGLIGSTTAIDRDHIQAAAADALHLLTADGQEGSSQIVVLVQEGRQRPQRRRRR